MKEDTPPCEKSSPLSRSAILFRPMHLDPQKPAQGGWNPRPWHVLLLTLLGILLAVWCIYPFTNLKINPAFNSDTALVLTAITERVPLAETIFSWGTARSGSAFAVLGSIYFHLFGDRPLVDFLSFLDALVVILGCCAFIELRKADGSKSHLLLVPAGFLLVFANFNVVPTSVSFSFTITDLGHRPELMALLVFLSWLFLSLERYRPFKEAAWWLRALLALFLAVVATWVSDLALIAGLLFACLATLRSLLLRLRLPWETFAIWAVSVVSLQVLRRLSSYGSQETRQLFKFPSSETLRTLLGTAIANLLSNLTAATWLAILLLVISLATWGLVSWKRGGVAPRQRGFWQAVNLLLLGVLALGVPLASNWVFANGAQPRYFSVGALLLCVGASQTVVFFVQEWLRGGSRPLLGLALAAPLFVPLAISGAQAAGVRHKLAVAGKSPIYRAGELLLRDKVRGIIGPYWHSYAYVLARPGLLKATTIDPDWDRSVSNTMAVLSANPLAWIAKDSRTLLPVMSARGAEFQQLDSAPAIPLPTGASFKQYMPSGVLRINFGTDNTWLYLREGWSGTEREGSRTWMWALGHRAALEVPLSGGQRYRMSIKANTLANQGQRQEITVTVDGQLAGTFRFSPNGGPLEAALSIPASREDLRKRRIEFGFAYAVIPKIMKPPSDDARELAVSFERAEFTPER